MWKEMLVLGGKKIRDEKEKREGKRGKKERK